MSAAANVEVVEQKSDAQGWARRINASMADPIASIIATGQAFIDAKRELTRGLSSRVFSRIARNSESAIKIHIHIFNLDRPKRSAGNSAED